MKSRSQISTPQAPTLIPLSKLVPHEENVRRTDKHTDIEQLAASIAAHGLLQNLSVIARGDGRFGVVAGGRRLAALRLLSKQGKLARGYAVPCNLLDPEDGGEASLAENIQRQAMNPMDEMEAFVRLADSGLDADAIAQRFGASIRHVEQRLALGRLSPKLRAGYRKGDLTLDVARAFCTTDDHAAQERLYKQLGKPITHALTVRNALSGGRVAATDRFVRFVGIDAYRAAGGRVVEDLFEEDCQFLDDGDLLQRLASDKCEALRQELIAEGWGWAEIQFRHGAVEGCASERLRPVERALTSAEALEASELENEIDRLDAALEKDKDDEALWTGHDEAEAKLLALRERVRTFPADLMAYAGALVSISHDGAPLLTRGLIKRADLKTVRRLQQKTEAANGTEKLPGAAATCANMSGLSKRLTNELTQARTRGLRNELSRAPHVALALVVHAMTKRSKSNGAVSGFALETRPSGFSDVDDFEQRRTELLADEEPLPQQHLSNCIGQSDEVLLKNLALLAAEILDLTSDSDDARRTTAETLAHALDLDMHTYWGVDTEFWERAPKSYILSALSDAPELVVLSQQVRKVRLEAYAKLKKADLAKLAFKMLGPDWLPDTLITLKPAGAYALTGKALAELGDDAA